MYTPDIRPRTISDIIDAVFRVFFQKFGPLVTIAAVVTGPIVFLRGLVRLWIFNDITQVDPANIDSLGDLFSGQQIAASIVLGLIGWAASMLAAGAMVRAVADVHLGREVDWQASVRQAMGFLAPLLAGSVLFGIGVSIGFVLLVIPGIFFALSWAVFSPAIVIEGRTGTNSLTRSWDLVTGRRWQTLGAFVVVFILTWIVSALLHALFGFGGDFTFADVVVDTVIGIVLAPLTAVTVTVVYLELRARKENYDAAALAADIAPGPKGPESIIR